MFAGMISWEVKKTVFSRIDAIFAEMGAAGAGEACFF